MINFTLPPLRKRKADIPLLVTHFLQKLKPRFGEKEFSSEAFGILCLHDWPGNIRELENLVQEHMVLVPKRRIGPEDLQLKSEKTQHFEGWPSFQAAKKTVIDRFERDYLSTMLRIHNGSITLAAKAAGKDRRSFGRLVAKHGLSRYNIRADRHPNPKERPQ